MPCMRQLGHMLIIVFRYPRARLSAGLLDSHVYVCRRHILDALHQKPRFDSIREEFIPWLCKPQYQRTKQEKYGSGKNIYGTML